MEEKLKRCDEAAAAILLLRGHAATGYDYRDAAELLAAEWRQLRAARGSVAGQFIEALADHIEKGV